MNIFRYDPLTSNPIDVTVLDLQECRIGSLVNDINHLLYTSLDGPTRKQTKEYLLIEYYNIFKDILLEKSIPVPFNYEEFLEEINAKIVYGLIIGVGKFC